MKYHPIAFPHLLGIALLFLTLSISAAAQRIEPDEQILRQMTDYVIDLQIKAATDAARSSRPKLSARSEPIIRNAAYNRRASVNYQPAAVSLSPGSAVFALERKAFDILNGQRAAKGLPALKWSDDLARVARLHSGNMARQKFFSHTGRDGLSVSHRARMMGVGGWRGIGENIAFNQGFSKPVEMACQHWMTSRGHRDNILNRNYTESGIGVAVAPDGGYFFTQVFIVK